MYILDFGQYRVATGQFHAPAAIYPERGHLVHVTRPWKIRAGCEPSVHECGAWYPVCLRAMVALLRLNERFPVKNSPVEKHNSDDFVGSEESHIVDAAVCS